MARPIKMAVLKGFLYYTDSTRIQLESREFDYCARMQESTYLDLTHLLRFRLKFEREGVNFD